jgi:hypothetical protein
VAAKIRPLNEGVVEIRHQATAIIERGSRKPEGMRKLRTHRCRLEGNIKINLQGILYDGMVLVRLAQNANSSLLFRR